MRDSIPWLSSTQVNTNIWNRNIRFRWERDVEPEWAKNGDIIYQTTENQIKVFAAEEYNGYWVALWWSGVTYKKWVYVLQGGRLYESLVAHVSGIFAVDLAAGKRAIRNAIARWDPEEKDYGMASWSTLVPDNVITLMVLDTYVTNRSNINAINNQMAIYQPWTYTITCRTKRNPEIEDRTIYLRNNGVDIVPSYTEEWDFYQDPLWVFVDVPKLRTLQITVVAYLQTNDIITLHGLQNSGWPLLATSYLHISKS